MASHPTLPQNTPIESQEFTLANMPLSRPVAEMNEKANDMHPQSHARNESSSSIMTSGRKKSQTSVSFAQNVDPPSKRSSTCLAPKSEFTPGPELAFRSVRRPTLAELPARTKDNDVPARRTFLWVCIAAIVLCCISLALSIALLVLSVSKTVMCGSIWNIIAAIIGMLLPILAIYYWRLPNAPSTKTKLFQGFQGVLWSTVFIIMCILGGLREEEDVRAILRHKGIEYNEMTSERVEAVMIAMAIMGLLGIANTATGFYIVQKGRYQVDLNNAPPAIRASMLMMQPGPSQRRGGSMSSEYPDYRPQSLIDDPEAGTDIYTKAAEDYLEMNKVHLKELTVK